MQWDRWWLECDKPNNFPLKQNISTSVLWTLCVFSNCWYSQRNASEETKWFRFIHGFCLYVAFVYMWLLFICGFCLYVVVVYVCLLFICGLSLYVAFVYMWLKVFMWFRFLGGLGLYMAKILGDFPLILCIFLCILGSYNRSLSFGSLKPEKNLQYAHGHHAVLPTSACFCIPFILECRCSCLMDDTVIIYLSISMWGGHSFLLFSFVDAVFRWFLRSICCIWSYYQTCCFSNGE